MALGQSSSAPELVLAASAGPTTRRVKHKPPGGCPFKLAPGVRGAKRATVPPEPQQKLCKSCGGFPTEGTNASPNSPVVATQAPTGIHRIAAANTTCELTPRSKRAGAFVQGLVGDEKGHGAKHWRLVQELDAVDGLLQEDLDRRKILAQKVETRNFLEMQVNHAKGSQARHRESSARWGQKMHEEAEQFKDEEQRKRIQAMEAQRTHNAQQTSIVEDLQRRRDAEKQKNKRIEERVVEASYEAKRRQEQKEAEKKQKSQQMADEMAEAMRQSAVKKAEAKRMDGLRDIELMRQQTIILDEQDRRRHEYFENIRQSQAKSAQYSQGAGNDLARKQAEAEEKARNAQEEKRLKEDANHQEKQRRLRQMQSDGTACVKQQLAEQAAQRQRDSDENKRRRDDADRDTAAAAVEAKAKEEKRRMVAKENSDYLMAQIARKDKVGKDQMSEHEQAMNKGRLERANHTGSLQLLFKNKQLQYRAVDV